MGLKKKKLILVSGPPGVGKSSLSLEIAKSTHSVLLDKDCVDEPFSPNDRGDFYTKEIEPKVLQALLNLAALNLKVSQSVIIDLPWTHILINSPEQLSKINSFLLENKIQLKVIELYLDEKKLKERIEKRNLLRDKWKFSEEGWLKFKSLDKIDSLIPLDHFLVDASQPILSYLPSVLEYLDR